MIEKKVSSLRTEINREHLRIGPRDFYVKLAGVCLLVKRKQLILLVDTLEHEYFVVLSALVRHIVEICVFQFFDF